MRLIILGVFAALLVSVKADGEPVRLNTCGSQFAANQQWLYNQGAKGNMITLVSTGECLDVSNYGTSPESIVWTWTCHPSDTDPNHQNQEFKVNPDGTIVEISTGMCLDRSQYGTTPGTVIWMYTCTGAFNQKWAYNATDKTFRAPDAPDMCMQSGGAIPQPPRACDQEPLKSMDACNYALPLAQRVASIVNNLTESEKIGLFTNGASSVSRLNINSYQWWSEALHGVGGSPGVSFTAPTPNATSFPQVVLSAASFNASLFRAIGSTISTEARAMNNIGHAGLTFWAPNINIVRDPRWGRGQETPGEDPYLTATYAANFVPGMQQGEDPAHLKVSSCCKHYYAYNLENWNGMDRYHFDAIITAQDEADTWLPAWQSCIERGQASALMCSYNAVNGTPSCANTRILTTLARETWGFQGYITSDCDAVDNVQNAHHYTNNSDATCAVTLGAGMDIDCGGFIPSHLQAAIDDGSVPIALVNQRLSELFMVQFRLGMFDPVDVQPYLAYNYSDKLDTLEHQQLALQAAEEGIVLLQNDGALPLAQGKYKNIAVVGPNGDATTTMQGNYQGTPPYLISPLAGIQAYAPSSTFVQGCQISGSDQSGFAAAQKAAANADATVIVVGLDQSQESEGNDRYITDLPGVQNQFITAVAASSAGPVIVVVMAGGSVDLTVPTTDPKVSAVLWVGYPGQSGGIALANILFGATNPSGRMPYTLFTKDVPNEFNFLDMHMRPGTGNAGRTYRFYTGAPVFEFGHGLSYTTFTFTAGSAGLSASFDQVEKYALTNPENYLAPAIDSKFYSLAANTTITVNNTGSVAGRVSVLAFLVPPNPGQNGNPLRYLFWFDKTYLLPGQSQTFTVPAQAHDLTVADEYGRRRALRGDWKLVINNGDLTLPLGVG
eukprot:TRINITY_DN10277_c0_g1_i1.p1 TRINITY_DN10277_c0_g1~~TRINITY_DN10277_c0_g1_i1.p1  ORF type:complete len:893 (+),score=326.58 TRINITY_DN10277_c0_g1_i1:215-2893(+)